MREEKASFEHPMICNLKVTSKVLTSTLEHGRRKYLRLMGKLIWISNLSPFGSQHAPCKSNAYICMSTNLCIYTHIVTRTHTRSRTNASKHAWIIFGNNRAYTHTNIIQTRTPQRFWPTRTLALSLSLSCVSLASLSISLSLAQTRASCLSLSLFLDSSSSFSHMKVSILCALLYHVSMHTYMPAPIFVCVWISIFECVYARMYACMFVHVYVCIHVYACVCMYICIQTTMYVYII